MIRLSTGLRRGMLNQYGFLSYMNRGVIELRNGTQPASADITATGDLLAWVTHEGLTFVEGDYTNGLRITQDISGALLDDGNWRITPVKTGTVTWWRWRWWLADPNPDVGNPPRVDGAYGDALVLATPSLLVGSQSSVQLYLNLIGG